MEGVFEGCCGGFPQMGHPPLGRECLGNPHGREEGRREELQGKREGLGHNADFFVGSESLGPWDAGAATWGTGSPGSRGLVCIVGVQA